MFIKMQQTSKPSQPKTHTQNKPNTHTQTETNTTIPTPPTPQILCVRVTPFYLKGSYGIFITSLPKIRCPEFSVSLKSGKSVDFQA